MECNVEILTKDRLKLGINESKLFSWQRIYDSFIKNIVAAFRGMHHLHNVKAFRLAPHHKPLTTLADIFRVSAKNNLI